MGHIMTIETRPPAPRALGCLLALGALGGGVIGTLKGQPSAGLVIGFGAGAIIAITFWLYDRTRSR